MTKRFTLAELTALHALPAGVYAKVAYGCHLVLTEQQASLPSPELRAACAIISVEDEDGITLAVLKHRTGAAWDRRGAGDLRLDAPMTAFRAGLPSSEMDGAPFVASRDPDDPSLRSHGERIEPVVSRRHPLMSPPDQFQRGVDAMASYLKQQFDFGGPIREIKFMYGINSIGADMTRIDGEFSLRYLAKAFLDNYGPGITVSDEVKIKLAKRAMKLRLLRDRKMFASLSFLGPYDDTKGEDQIDTWDDIINVEGIIDIDALVRTFWRVMKG